MSERERQHFDYDLVETESIYVDRKDRYVVSLIAGYTDEDIAEDYPGDDYLPTEPTERARMAAHYALELTRDEGQRGTAWFVYDRQERWMHSFEQAEIEEL